MARSPLPARPSIGVLAAVLAAGCAPRPGGSGPDPSAPLPEPGIETRALESRAGIDVVSYRLELDLTGLAAGRLDAVADLRVRATAALADLPLDLVGLEVRSVEVGGAPVPYGHDGVVLAVRPRGGVAAGDTVVVRIRYGGRPAEGLFFLTDAAGGPTVFADNWPNRARWWFPSNDHPSDKAAVEYAVTVPAGLEVVANGRPVGGPAAATGRTAPGAPDPGVPAAASTTTWRWRTDVPIPTYTMVIGVARFGRAVLGEAACGAAPSSPRGCVEVSVWPLAGDSAFGVERFRRAPDMVEFLTDLVGPFPYEKLAHVESSTRFGGMENASAIFYAREPWESRTMGEGVIVHETAHQWFGDHVTEGRWAHLWLSEGFASYFDPLYYEARDGRAAFRERMEAARREYVASDVVGYPMVHDTTDLYWLLNENSYPKGAWVLHMLRGLLGDDAFFRGIRRYFAAHAGGTALTDDLRMALEAESGRDLEWFFRQWAYAPGYPQLALDWRVESDGAGARVLVATIRQTQPAAWPAFRIPTTLRVTVSNGEVDRPIVIEDREQTLRIPLRREVTDVTIDPEGWVLKELEVRGGAAPPGGGAAPESAPSGRG